MVAARIPLYLGGFGSGGWLWRSSRGTVEGHRSLDINWLHRGGHLVRHSRRVASWRRNGEPRGAIQTNMLQHAASLVLEYRVRNGHDQPWAEVQQPVPLVWTSCHFRGRRPWFSCLGCRRRVGKLYLVSRYFVCRRCGHLAYESQRENWGHRSLSKAQKIRERLGGSASILDPFPAKPKGMHWRTYRRWLARHDDALERDLAYLAMEVDKMMPGKMIGRQSCQSASQLCPLGTSMHTPAMPTGGAGAERREEPRAGSVSILDPKAGVCVVVFGRAPRRVHHLPRPVVLPRCTTLITGFPQCFGNLRPPSAYTQRWHVEHMPLAVQVALRAPSPDSS